MYRHREFRMVETERLTVSEWTSEGSLERLWIVSVGADGTPPVIHRGTYDGTCKRVDIFTNVNLGGIAEVYAFVPCMGTEAFFSFWKFYFFHDKETDFPEHILYSAPARQTDTSAIQNKYQNKNKEWRKRL